MVVDRVPYSRPRAHAQAIAIFENSGRKDAPANDDRPPCQISPDGHSFTGDYLCDSNATFHTGDQNDRYSTGNYARHAYGGKASAKDGALFIVGNINAEEGIRLIYQKRN